MSLTTESLMNSALQPQGVFFLFSFFSLVAIFFMYYCIPETKGLTDSEKMQLFYPGMLHGRKLRPGEDPWVTSTKAAEDDQGRHAPVRRHHRRRWPARLHGQCRLQ